jgi:hypothetical protein
MLTVHIAGPVEDGLQRCTRCGEVLINYRGQYVMIAAPKECSPNRVGPSFWPQGGFIGKDGGFSCVIAADASDIDEIACGGMVQ